MKLHLFLSHSKFRVFWLCKMVNGVFCKEIENLIWLISCDGCKIGRGKKVDHINILKIVNPNNNSTWVEVLVLLIVANRVWWKFGLLRQLK